MTLGELVGPAAYAGPSRSRAGGGRSRSAGAAGRSSASWSASSRPIAGVVEVVGGRGRRGAVPADAPRREPHARWTSRGDRAATRPLLRSLVSTHAILGVQRRRVRLAHGPARTLARGRRRVPERRRPGRSWSARRGRADTMLSSPIILYDYPQVAPESPGDFFDGTEIDEMLTLRIMTLTDEEKGAMAAVDERAGALLARTEALARDELLGLHGTVRGLRPVAGGGPRMDNWDPEADRRRLECVHVGPAELRQGDRVRLRPRGRADIMDMALAGQGRDHRGDRAGLRGPGLPGGHRGRRPRQGPRHAPAARAPLLLPAGGSRTPRVRRRHDGPLPFDPRPEPIHGPGLRDRDALGLRPQPDLRRPRLRGDVRLRRGQIAGRGAGADRPAPTRSN